MIDPKKVDKANLVDIQDIIVDKNLPKEERIADFIRQVRNPYLCKCGNMVVQSVFADTDVSLTERLAQFLKIT